MSSHRHAVVATIPRFQDLERVVFHTIGASDSCTVRRLNDKIEKTRVPYLYDTSRAGQKSNFGSI